MKNYLYHHGIKGQKWGVRNGPPYPLSESKKSSREKRLEKAMSKNIGSLDANQTVAIVNLALYTSALAVAAAVPRLRVAKERNNHLKENTAKIQQIKKPHSEASDQEAINKSGYDSEKPQYRMNCTMCSTAYELRRRGYDVKANTSTVGRSFKDVASWFDNTTKKDFTYPKNFKSLKDELEKQPDGARGNVIAGVGMFDSYHSMVWEKKNNKVIIRDCQSNMTYDSIDESIIREKSRHKYGFIRTDNREINWDAVRDAVVPK